MREHNSRLAKCIIHHNNNNNHTNSSNGRPRFIENSPVTVIRRHSFEKFEKIKYFCTNRGPSSIRRESSSKRSSALTSETTLTASANLQDLPNSIRDPDDGTKDHDNFLSTSPKIISTRHHDDKDNTSDALPLAQDTDEIHNEPTASTSCDYLDCKLPTISYSQSGKVITKQHENNHDYQHQKCQEENKEIIPVSTSSSSISLKDANVREVL